MTTPSAFTKDPEDLIREIGSWLEELESGGGTVSLLTVHRHVQPLVAALLKERQARSTSASLIRDAETRCAQLLNQVAYEKNLCERLTADIFSLERRLPVRVMLWVDHHNLVAIVGRRVRAAMSIFMPSR